MAWITNPFPVFLISLAFRGRYFHSHFRSSAMNAYYIQDRLEGLSWHVTTSRSPVKRKSQNWQTTWKRSSTAPVWITLHRSFATLRASKKAITRAFDDDVEFQERWQNTSGTWLKPLLTTRLILIRGIKRMSTALATLAGKLAELSAWILSTHRNWSPLFARRH